MAELNEQQNHLAQVLQQQQSLVQEINELNTQVDNKKQMALKLQGVAEYLDQIGIKLPEPETSPTSEEEVVEPEVQTPAVVTE
tara:strand:- start:2274 stop:2522 length:249 start_codon:yes stop_codon:yes gene_type:complete